MPQILAGGIPARVTASHGIDTIFTGLSLCRDNNHKLPLDRRDHDKAKTYGLPRKAIAARQWYLLNTRCYT